jgi:hypothetical protein
MSQAIHIFKKDVERLRYHLALTLLAVVAFCWVSAANVSGPGPTVLVLAVSWWFLIAAVIHLEPLPGTGHFWLTRPYRRSSLFVAKALFIITFVNVSLGVADLIILHARGFPVFANAGGLIWAQVLLVCAFEIPVAAIVSVTSGLLAFLTATLILLLITLASYLLTSTLHISLAWGHIEWVREYVVLSLAFIIGAGILYWQYAHRATLLSRVAALAGPILLFICAAAFPWTIAFALQSWLFPSRAQTSTISVRLDTEQEWAGQLYRDDKDRLIADIPITIHGTPSGNDLKVYGVRMTLSAPDGRTLPIEEPPSNSFETDSSRVSLRLVVPERWYQKYRREALRAKGILYFALCDEPRYLAIHPSKDRVGVPGVGLCTVNAKSFVCSSALRPSANYVEADLTERSTRGVVHSNARWAGSGDTTPFPAAFNIDPVFRWSIPTLAPITDVVIARSEPIAYAVRSFDLGRVVLADFRMQN